MRRTQKTYDLVTVIDTDDLRVQKFVADSDRLVLCFSGIGRDENQAPVNEFIVNAINDSKDSVLFIVDKNRTWLNGPGLLAEIFKSVDVFFQEHGTRDIYCLGHSMGGFSALIMPFYMPVRAVAAFSPQFSISPEVVPDEKRWEIYRDRISEIKIPSIKEFLADQTEYYVFHGRHPREAPQREPFPRKANLHHFIMRNTVHNTSQRLKQFGLLSDVIQAAFSRDTPRVTDLLGQALGKKRADETGNN